MVTGLFEGHTAISTTNRIISQDGKGNLHCETLSEVLVRMVSMQSERENAMLERLLAIGSGLQAGLPVMVAVSEIVAVSVPADGQAV